jgi:dienelactone hydrolase
MDGVGYREQIKANARRFAADGYYCVAPDLSATVRRRARSRTRTRLRQQMT